jgi:signal transduction histidine kinase
LATTTPRSGNGKESNGTPPLEWPRPVKSSSPAREAHSAPEAPEELAHDARNVLAAMGLYCDLLAQPGVLNRRYAHYAGHLKVVIDSGISLVGRLAGPLSRPREAALAGQAPATLNLGPKPPSGNGLKATATKVETPLCDLGTEIERRRGMLSVLLGPRIAFEIECLPCSGLIRLEPMDLGRILVNLIRNAGEAMPNGGRVRISVQQGGDSSFLPEAVPGVLPHVRHDIVPTLNNRGAGKTVLLCIQDNGPGMDSEILGHIFDKGFSTKTGRGALGRGASTEETNQSETGAGLETTPSSRGLGLGIVRSLVEAAGGQLRVVSRPGAGTRFEIEFPMLWAAPSGLQRGEALPRQMNRAHSVPGGRRNERQVPLPVEARVKEQVAKHDDPEDKPAPVRSVQSLQSTKTNQSTPSNVEQEGSRVQC